MGMFSKLKGKGRDEGASDALVEDIEEMAAMAAMEEANEPPEPQSEEAVAEAPAPEKPVSEELLGPVDPPADDSGVDDSPLGDDILSMFEEEEDAGDPMIRDMAAEAEEVDAEDLLSEILSLTEDLESA